jgi:Fe-S-cluster containining protein
MHPLLQRKGPLPVPRAAREFHKKIFTLLTSLEANGAGSCLDPEFRTAWAEILSLIDSYQKEIARASHLTVSCAAGCTACCCHWVEDVNSFEAEIMAEHLKEHHPEKISGIVRQCGNDEISLRNLNEIVESKLAAARNDPSAAAVDPVDLLLASFYRLRSPCPLLENDRCLAYHVRPLTCRMYVSFSAPERCDPAITDEGDIPTYLFDLEEGADGIIDRLHFRFVKHNGVTGLRPLLALYLG